MGHVVLICLVLVMVLGGAALWYVLTAKKFLPHPVDRIIFGNSALGD